MALVIAIRLYGPKVGTVDCDESSKWNHSRNFVSPWMNFLVFDNGYHTVHHQRARLHWAEARAAHEAVAEKIDPALNESSIPGYCWKTYVLGMRKRGESPRVASAT